MLEENFLMQLSFFFLSFFFFLWMTEAGETYISTLTKGEQGLGMTVRSEPQLQGGKLNIMTTFCYW